jgi:hypothetical protein
MANKLFFATIGFLLLLPNDRLLAHGAKVVLFLKDGGDEAGELLAVRDTALLIDTLEDRGEDTTATQIAGIISVNRGAIQTLIVRGESLRIKGILYGALIGAGLGAAIGLADGNDPDWPSPGHTAGQKALIGLSYGAPLGASMGGIIGAAWSSKDKQYNVTVDEWWASLKAVARYPDKEPEFLQVIK